MGEGAEGVGEVGEGCEGGLQGCGSGRLGGGVGMVDRRCGGWGNREEGRRGAAVQAFGRDKSDGGESHLAEHEAEEVAGQGSAAASETVGDVDAFEGAEGWVEQGADGDPVGGADFCGLEFRGREFVVCEEEYVGAEDHESVVN